MLRYQALEEIASLTHNLPTVVTCAATSRELAAIADRPNYLYLLDSMGLVGSVATGLALDGDEPATKVVGIEGDGSLFMNPNVLSTGGFLKPEKLLLVVLDNGVYGSTAGLPTYSSSIDLGVLAEANGWVVTRAESAAELRERFSTLLLSAGPALLHVQIEPGNKPDIPKLLEDPVFLARRFQEWLSDRSKS